VRRYTGSLRVDFQENSRRCPLHGRRYAQVQEHTVSDERAQTQVSFAESIIEQQRIQTCNRAVDVGHTQETEEKIWKCLLKSLEIRYSRDVMRI